MNTADIYDDLKSATVVELLQAALVGYIEAPDVLEGLRLAIKIAGPEGWLEIAPTWLKAYRERAKEKP